MKFNKVFWCLGVLLTSALLVQAQDDTIPPALVGFAFSPQQLDTSSSSSAITLSFHITDNLSGFSSAFVDFLSPSGTVSQAQYWYASNGLVSGTTMDGVIQGQLSFPAFSESGTWTIDVVRLQDKTGNLAVYRPAELQALGFPTSLIVSSQADVIAPTLVGFNFSPQQLDTSSSSSAITLSFHIKDNLSGFSSAFVDFLSPSGTVSQAQYWYASNSLVSGTTMDGVIQGQLSFPAFSESGTWTISRPPNIEIQRSMSRF